MLTSRNGHENTCKAVGNVSGTKQAFDNVGQVEGALCYVPNSTHVCFYFPSSSSENSHAFTPTPTLNAQWLTSQNYFFNSKLVGIPKPARFPGNKGVEAREASTFTMTALRPE